MNNSSSLSQAIKMISVAPPIKVSHKEKIKEGVFGDTGQFKISVANDKKTRIQAYQLLYRIYVEKEFAAPHPSKMWYSEYDACAETITFVVKNNEKVVAALTLVTDSSAGLPAHSAYPTEVDQCRNKCERLAEIISLGIEADLRFSREILVKLFNYAVMAACHIQYATNFIITINPRHASFYLKKLLFKTIGEDKDYGKVGGAPASLLLLDLKDPYNEINNSKSRTLYKGFYSEEMEVYALTRIRAQKKPMTPEELRYFFLEMRNISLRNINTQLLDKGVVV